MALIDWAKGVVYVSDADNSRFDVYSIASMAQIGRLNVPSYFSLGSETAAVSPGGAIYIQPFAGNTCKIFRYDTDAGLVTGTWGEYSSELTNTKTSFQWSSQLLVVPVSGSGEYLLCLSLLHGALGVLWCESEIQYVYGAPAARLEIPSGVSRDPWLVDALATSASPLIGAAPFIYNDLLWARSAAVLGAQYPTYTEAYVINWDEVDGTTFEIYLVTCFGASSIQVDHIGSIPGGVFYNGAVYDTADNTIIISGSLGGGGAGMRKWSRATGVVWTFTGGSPALDPQSYVNGTLGWSTPGWWTVIDTRSAQVIFSGYRTDGIPANAYWFDPIYNSASNSAIWVGSPPTQAFFGLAFANGCPLQSIVTDICLRCGLTSDQINVTELANVTVAGYVFDGIKTGADAIKELQQAFFFDVIESDYAVKFVTRGGPPLYYGQLYQADLASAGNAEEGNYWEHARSQDQDLPVTILVNFSDFNNECLPNVAYSKRTNAPVATVKTRQRQTISLPIVMGLSDAQLIAQTALWTCWAERDTFSTVLGLDWLFLDPADVVVVSLNNGFAYTVRVASIDLGADYTVKATFTGLDQTTYTG